MAVIPSPTDINPNGTNPLGRYEIFKARVRLMLPRFMRRPLPSILSSVNCRSESTAQKLPFTPTRERFPIKSVFPPPVGPLSPAEYIQLLQGNSSCINQWEN